ncbi:FAD dependent oxidoreductase [Suillus clintonianus]|uniref:FAD dependent oxidoreductase n=1 Tax=Suillus clintonianus TaxID=1904413 RepID=UPI001B886DC9|nr:FAD dependent oxidoreductase [Suillus clintonianus]KAG2138374.1 FAD dependent oxidoreductase [Suillus clintonianus]
MDQVEQRNIVIIGGGIIGCSIAYYLSRHPSYSTSTTNIIVLEASANGVAQGASGKAGGLVAKWAYPREIVDISFPEHIKLAEEHNGAERWGWRFVGCGSWEGKGEALGESGSGVGKGGNRKSLEKTLGFEDTALASRADKGLPDDLTWVKDELTTSYSPMSGPDGTAQVHPYLFTTSMLDLAKEKGVQLVKGTAISVERVDRHVTGVTYHDLSNPNRIETLPATHVVLSAGAWSPSIIPSLPIAATRAHSVTIHPKANVTISPYVLFTEILLSHSHVSPEIYARPDNEVYACGPGDDSILPANVDDVEVDLAACQSITNHIASISQELREGTVDKRQACFLPVVRTGGGPIIGEADNIAKGLYIATGHTCWGICNAPGTGKVIAELIMGRKTRSRNLTKLAPSRFL